ncbi:Ig-like domain-containing protein [Alteromonas sp. 14N.309.X.WAT.G.H12]|uniref:Ig-like domain-containing protein n=1 Tax=Alteromonas sp. 14N.309.X.WAT.G.H12 TaxID=3120824 RepID=UPI002FD16D58
MKTNLLHTLLLSSASCLLLSGCGGSDEGFNPKFSSDEPVSFSDAPIVANLEENNGVVAIDLLDGATIDGKPASEFDGLIVISQLNIEAQNNFVTPQAPSNTVANQTISPFRLSDDGLSLLVDTDAFSDSLRQCDTTDKKGAKDEEGNTIADGIRDFPQSASYNVSYIIDDGYDYEAGQNPPKRTATITVVAQDDAVTQVAASDVEVPAGGQAQVIASTLPAFACDSSLQFTVEDESIATIDANGVVTAKSVGQTRFTATSLDNPDASATATITVTAAFSLSMTNDDKDELGASLGTKEVPACVAAGINVQPIVVNHELNGSYTYKWQSTNDVDFPVVGSEASGFGAFGVIATPTQIGEVSTVSVRLESGDTGATPLSEVTEKTVDLTTVANAMCNPGESAHAAGFNTDFMLNGEGAPYKGNASATAVATSVSGSGKAVEITAGTVVNDDGVAYSRVAQEVWNKQRNWYSATYGRGLDSIGKSFKFAVWVKLEEVPSEPVSISHVIVPWVYDGIPDGATGYGGRMTEGGGVSFTQELASTTEWQYVEFVDDSTGARIWTVPDTWSQVTDVFTLWEFYGLPAGAKVLIDDYSVVPVE